MSSVTEEQAARLARAYPGAEFRWEHDQPLSTVTFYTAGTDTEIAAPDTVTNMQAAIDAEPTPEKLAEAHDARPDPVTELAEILLELLPVSTLLPTVQATLTTRVNAVKDRHTYATLRAEALLL